MKRDKLSDLNAETFDVVVIGAGINGCSAAQQLSAKGFRTLIVEKGDFAEGATSKSSRLLHCGLRHLTPGKSLWDFVRNPVYLATALINAKASMDARSDIANSLPELTHEVNFCFPIYKEDPFTPRMVDLAFSLLSVLGPKDLPLGYKRHKPSDHSSTPFASYLREPSKIQGMAVFREYLFDWPERIAIDALKDASQMGAVARNFTEFTSLTKNEDDSWSVELVDCIDPAETATIQAKLVLNVGGAWSDQISQHFKSDLPQKVLKLKGAHIAVQLPPELSNWGMIAMNRVKEPLYCVPNRGLHLVGLNRVPYDKDASGVRAEEDEVDWLIGELNHLMPSLGVTRSDVKFTMAGLQPITFDPNEPHGSRAIKIHDLKSNGFKNILALTGGPIMTHRQVGKNLARAALKRINPSLPAKSLSKYASQTTKDLHATRGQNRSIQANSDLLKRIATEEQPTNLADILFRRTGIAWNKGQGRDQLEEIADVVAEPLGWDEARTKLEIQSYLDFLDQDYPDHTK